MLAWFFIYFPWGRAGVQGLANGIAWMINSAHAGTGFAFASWVKPGAMDMAVSRTVSNFTCSTVI